MDDEEMKRIEEASDKQEKDPVVDAFALRLTEVSSETIGFCVLAYQQSEEVGITTAGSIISAIAWNIANNYDECYALIDKIAKSAKMNLQLLEKNVNKNV